MRHIVNFAIDLIFVIFGIIIMKAVLSSMVSFTTNFMNGFVDKAMGYAAGEVESTDMNEFIPSQDFPLNDIRKSMGFEINFD